MSLQRICDRCGAVALELTLETTTRSVIVPAEDLSTLPVTKDVELALGVQARQDLCGPCFAATLLEYAIARFGVAVLTPAAVKAFVKRILAAAAAAATPASAPTAEPGPALQPVVVPTVILP